MTFLDNEPLADLELPTPQIARSAGAFSTASAASRWCGKLAWMLIHPPSRTG